MKVAQYNNIDWAPRLMAGHARKTFLPRKGPDLVLVCFNAEAFELDLFSET